jgi:hypothetical protein
LLPAGQHIDLVGFGEFPKVYTFIHGISQSFPFRSPVATATIPPEIAAPSPNEPCPDPQNFYLSSVHFDPYNQYSTILTRFV